MLLNNLTIRILRRARNLMRKGWTKDAYARNAKGRGVNFKAKTATHFCATGALRRASYEITGSKCGWHPTVALADRYVRDALDTGSLPHFNDYKATTKKQMLEGFGIAIELAKGE